MKENRQQNRDELNQALLQTKQTVMKQASLAVIAVVVTIVMVFAMTVAWYSNVLHTSDIVFQAKTWDFTFEGTINMRSGNQILAAPGNEGYVNLKVANVSNEANLLGSETNVSNIGVTVNIDKTDLGILNNRLYFYVDKRTDIDGETVDRIYINDSDSYTYTIFPGKTLALSEEYSNDYPIKWSWVYDVTGYYVRGKLQSDNTIAVEEYIRPIEFEYLEKISYDEHGNIVSYDGTDIDTYILENYLKKDGYDGGYSDDLGVYVFDKVIDSEGNTVPNLYRINDDLWIVLCTKEQINTNIEIDTKLGRNQPINDDAEETGSQNFSARIILTGTQVAGTPVTVQTEEMLITKINDGTKVFELGDNLTLNEALTLEAGTDVVLDLNGYTLTMNKTIEMQPNSSIGIINGTLNATDGSEITMIKGGSSEIYIDNVKSSGFRNGIDVRDNESESDLDSYIHITQSEITTSGQTVWLRGNGTKSIKKTTLVVEDSTLVSTNGYAIVGNGTESIYGTDIKVTSSTLTGYYAAIYHPMDKSIMTLTDSTLKGETGVAIKGGSVTIDNCTIVGTGIDTKAEPQLSGYADRGAGVYIEDNYSTLHGYKIDVVIKGEHTFIKSEQARSVYWNDGTAVDTGLAIYGGKYMSAVTDEDYITTFKEKYLADGKVATLLADGSYEVNDEPASTETE